MRRFKASPTLVDTLLRDRTTSAASFLIMRILNFRIWLSMDIHDGSRVHEVAKIQITASETDLGNSVEVDHHTRIERISDIKATTSQLDLKTMNDIDHVKDNSDDIIRFYNRIKVALDRTNLAIISAIKNLDPAIITRGDEEMTIKIIIIDHL